MRHVNFQAFLANLDANGLWYRPPVHIYLEIRYGLEMDREKVTHAEKEAFIMGPAQWILWNGQGLVRYMIWRPSVMKGDKQVPLVKMPEKQLDKAFEMTLGKWHVWRDNSSRLRRIRSLARNAEK
jgi:hypothetical protein